MSRFWLTIAAGALLAGCSATRESAVLRPMGADELFAQVRARNARVHTVQGSGLLTIESPEGAHNGGFEANVRKPDSVRVAVSGPFGVRAGTLLLSRDTFLYYNNLEHLAITGTPNGRALRSILPIRMQFDEILNALTGECPVAAAGDSLLADSLDGKTYRLLYRTADGRKEYDIDGETFIVRGYRVYDRAGGALLTAESSRIRMSDSIPMPRLLRIVFPAQRRSVTIAYDAVDVNRPVDCAFTLPGDADVRRQE